MTVERVLMEDVTVKINTGTIAAPNWVEVLGINEISVKPEVTKKDVSDMKSAGNMDKRPTVRGETWTLKGQRLEDPVTGTRDPGQEAVETLSAQVGYDAVKQFQFTSPGGLTRTFEATTTCTPFGGKNDDFSSWQAEVEKCGAAS